MKRDARFAFIDPIASPWKHVGVRNNSLTSRKLHVAPDVISDSQFDAFASSSVIAADGSFEPEAASAVFEPIIPQTETLVGMGVIAILCVVVCWVWANQVVPVSRTKLAIDKNRGELKDYLDELKASDPSNQEDLKIQDITTSTIAHTTGTIENMSTSDVGDNRALERWLFTDWLQDNKSANRRPGRQKEPALPILKDAKWNSGDNPVLVASTLIGFGVIFSAIVEGALSFPFV